MNVCMYTSVYVCVIVHLEEEKKSARRNTDMCRASVPESVIVCAVLTCVCARARLCVCVLECVWCPCALILLVMLLCSWKHAWRNSMLRSIECLIEIISSLVGSLETGQDAFLYCVLTYTTESVGKHEKIIHGPLMGQMQGETSIEPYDCVHSGYWCKQGRYLSIAVRHMAGVFVVCEIHKQSQHMNFIPNTCMFSAHDPKKKCPKIHRKQTRLFGALGVPFRTRDSSVLWQSWWVGKTQYKCRMSVYRFMSAYGRQPYGIERIEDLHGPLHPCTLSSKVVAWPPTPSLLSRISASRWA
jgi:hypothetical protein